MSILDELPEYMRYAYKPLLDVFAEAEKEIAKEGLPTFGVDYAKDAVSTVVARQRNGLTMHVVNI